MAGRAARLKAPATGLVSRRGLLAGAAGLGATAWVAPAILSVDAVAAATCQPIVINFAKYSTGFEGLSNAAPTLWIGEPAFDATVTYDSDQDDGVAAIGYAGSSGGKTTDFIQLELSNDEPGVRLQYVQLRFQFFVPFTSTPLPVQNLSFTLLDVDQDPAITGSSWKDLVEVTATGGGVDRTPVITPASTDVVAAPAPPPATVEPLLTAGQIADNSPDGNAVFVYSDPVDTVVVRFIVGEGPVAQQIGIWRFVGCVV